MFYQQEDLKYPGKILAIIPISNKQKEMINNFFMQIKKRSYFLYNCINKETTRIK
jgi:hypothetical protein